MRRHGYLNDGNMKELVAENTRLKKMYIEEKLNAEILNETITKKW
jgi:putative transposase